ncbi:HDOD domain-containing protein [Sedimenticola selenatireducens]|uniref:HDOD domain-containing protein n=1 Tax=Sedimenticola selenatireducens TaxID=191960 RepID=A0A558DQ24_9GAMM|nr:HDOD domain-containing protein [Sedimenticola selenatireducens]TVO70466.1 HDOD domain-containing protein [Sedimenticola selenatireducens]TVT63043.1 MAG: HDOD domain-containing protein [Sedimenticola selenatireducens]
MTPQQLITEAGELLSLPEVCIRINQLADDPKSSSDEMGQVISQDAALSARLLKIVNSAFYGFPGKIDTISRAITIIGTKELRDLAMLTAACGVFGGIPRNLINMETFWHSSITCGVLARNLARTCQVLHPERLFLMGVLHDIGRLLMLQQLPNESRDIMLISKGRDDLIATAEREVLGFTHLDVGYELASAWGFPIPIQSAIRWHHAPEQSTRDNLECYIIYISNILADALVWDGDLDQAKEQIVPSVWQFTGLTPKQCDQAIAEISGEVRELYSILMEQSVSNGRRNQST